MALLTLYVLRGNYKLPIGKWPGPKIRSYLVEAIDSPDPWMAQVKDSYEEETLREEEADESFAPPGSDSGVDMSRGVSQTSREGEETSSSEEAHGTKRKREDSKSSTGEATGERPKKKHRGLSRVEVADEYQAMCSAFLRSLSQAKQDLEDQYALAEKALDEADLGLTESEKKRAEQEKAYLEKKEKHDEAEATAEDGRKTLKMLEQMKGLEATDHITSYARTTVEEYAAAAQLAGVAESQQKERKDAADEKAKKASDEFEERKESSAYAKVTLDDFTKRTSAPEAQLKSGLFQDWME